ncbi:MAG: hypothetical protein JO104_04215 [Candidatus Eremiobacteraeota bacterium]|nr:hypothetical protein [Candidatus Eremiobacteraeota bacterium]
MNIADLRCHASAVAAAVLVGCAAAQSPNQASPLVPSTTARSAHKLKSYVYVGLCCSFFNKDEIVVYDLALTGVARTITKRVTSPTYLTVDRSGRLYYVNGYSGSVTEYDRGSENPSRDIKLHGALAVATDSSNNLYLAACPRCIPYGYGRSSVAVYRAGTTKLLRSITKGIDAPVSVAIDTNDNVYVANNSYAHPSVAVYAAGSSKPLRRLTRDLTSPTELALDSSNDVFVLDSSANTSEGPHIVEYEAGSNKVLRAISRGLSSTPAIAVDGSGTLYAANAPVVGRSWISVYAPGVLTPSYRIKDGVSDPTLVTVDGENSLYVANENYDGGTICVYPSNSRRPLRCIQVRQGIDQPSSMAFGP